MSVNADLTAKLARADQAIAHDEACVRQMVDVHCRMLAERPTDRTYIVAVQGMQAEQLLTHGQACLMLAVAVAMLAPQQPQTIDAAVYVLANDIDLWRKATALMSDGQREAMADTAMRYEAWAIDDSERRLDPRELRWWR